MKVLIVIPARGGSKGIPKKNIRLMLNQPLISYCIRNALQSAFSSDVVVSTDDEEIARISNHYGAHIIMRPSELASDSITLDPVVYHAVYEMEEQKDYRYDVVITMQPTSPLLKRETLDTAIRYFLDHDFDTVLSGINKPHLSWTERDGEIVPVYEKRLNRQDLPKHLMETGAFFISKRTFIEKDSRFGPKISVFEIGENEAIDIDTPQDWWIAEKELSKKNILIRVEGYSEIGLGHIYRGLLIAYHLIDHNIRFLVSEKSDLGIQKIESSHFPYAVIHNEQDVVKEIKSFKCDILVNDMLDTDEKYVQLLKSNGVRVVNLEDLGQGARLADAVINDLYEKKNQLDHHYWGCDYYCIRDEFLLAKPSGFREKVEEVLVIFGGTDPCNLTKKLFDVIKKIENDKIHYTFILGMGYKNANALIEDSESNHLNVEIIQDVKLMTEYMSKADIAISSQGRTMFELASMGVPSILLAQNKREQHHEFGYMSNGFINLGLGTEVEADTIKETLLWLIKSPQVRSQMKEQMRKKDLRRGIERVVKIILDRNI